MSTSTEHAGPSTALGTCLLDSCSPAPRLAWRAGLGRDARPGRGHDRPGILRAAGRGHRGALLVCRHREGHGAGPAAAVPDDVHRWDRALSEHGGDRQEDRGHARCHLDVLGILRHGHVRWTFVNPAVVQVTLTSDKASPTSITEAFLDQGEHNYGLWEYSYYGTGGALDNRGANNHPLLGLSGPPVGSGDPSGRAPFYVTSRKYGVYADTLALGSATIAVNDRTSFTFDTPALTYNVIYGPSYAQVLARYNQLAGGSLMPPLWAFDPIWWRDDHHADFAANGVTNAQALVKKDADTLQRLQIPASAIWLDRPWGSGGGGLGGWGNFDFDSGPTGFPNPEEMIADLAGRNMYLLGWIANRANNSMVTDPVFAPGIFNAANGFAGNFTTTPGLDLRRPEVFAHFKNQLRDNFVKRGMRGYKIDRGEQGEVPAALQNELSILTAKAAYESTSDVLGTEGFTLGRNAYDRARKYIAVWNGDSSSTFAGMSDSLKQILRLGAIMQATTTSNSPRRARTKEGVGRKRSGDVDAARAAGRDRRRDDASPPRPNRPCSPACGLRPATAIRGAASAEPRQLARGQRDRRFERSLRQRARHLRERRREPSPARRAARRNRTSSRRRGAPVRCASRSVWPLQGSPASRNASLLIGAVAIASTPPRLRVVHGAHDRLVGRAAGLGAQHAGRNAAPSGGP